MIHNHFCSNKNFLKKISLNSTAQGRQGYHCGGVLVNKDYVVTGKCIESR